METILYLQSPAKINAAKKLGGVQNIAAKCGWHVQVIDGMPGQKRMKELLDFWNPAGVIEECGGIAATVNPSMFGRIPVVFLDHDPAKLPQTAFCVTHGSSAIAQMAARELMLGGAITFAYVPYGPRRFWCAERQKSFVDALSLNGHSCNIFSSRPSAKNPTQYQRRLRTFLVGLPKPCALFAANDMIAAEVLTAARFVGVKVPDELTVIGVDDATDICEHTEPTLSSVKPDFQRGGELAALLLAARIREGNSFRGERKRVADPLQVVRRASTRHLASQDRCASDALDLIRREACTGLTAKRVASIFPCSRRHAEARFRKATGHSFLEEIHSVQLARAKELLRHEGMPMKALSDFCGFKNPNSLRKFFKKQCGVSMTEWRNGALRASRI